MGSIKRISVFIIFFAVLAIFTGVVSAVDVTTDQVVNASGNVNSYVETNHSLPSSVNVSGSQVNTAQYLYLSSKAVLNINSNSNSSIPVNYYNVPTNPSENIHAGNIGKSEYLQIANDIKNCYELNGHAPDWAGQNSLGTRLRFENLVYIYSQILNSYKLNGVLPDFITVNQWSVITSANTKFFTMDQISNASNVVNDYVETNHTLPSAVNVSGTQLNMAQFLKLSTTTLTNINGHLNTSILSNSFNIPTNPSEDIHAGNMGKSEYLQIANDIKNCYEVNGHAPDYAGQNSLGTKIRFENLVYIYSQILNSYKINGVLPDFITVNQWSAVTNGNTKFFTMDQINNASSTVNAICRIKSHPP